MSEIGSGNNSSYPGGIDTNATPEVNSPASGKTRARKEVVEDLAAAVIAIENELGTDPAGSLSDVKTFLQLQHQTDGTHKSTHGPHVYIDEANYANFSAAVAAAPNKTLVVARSINLDANTVIGSTVSLMPLNPGVINKNGFTLTINGPVVGNPMHQWLSGFAAGDVVFGSISHVNPQWWQVNTTPGTTNMAIAIQSAINSLPSIIGGTVEIGSLMGVGSAGWVGLTITSRTDITIMGTALGAGFDILASPSQTLTNHGSVSKAMLKILNSSSIKFIGLKINGYNLAVCGIALEGVSVSTFANNSFYNFEYTEAAAIITENGSRNKYINNYTFNAFGGFNFGHQTTNMAEKFAIVQGNHFVDTNTGGTHAIGGMMQHCNIVGNVIKDCRAVGIYVGSDVDEESSHNNISDNIISGAVLSGIEVLVVTTALSKHNIICNNLITDSQYYGLYLIGLVDSQISGNTVVNCGDKTSVGGIMVGALATTGVAVYNIKINDNYVYDNRSGASRDMYRGIYFNGYTFNCYNIEISNNIVRNSLHNGISITGGTACTDLIVSNNIVTQATLSGIRINGAWTNGIISNNYAVGNNTAAGGDVDIFNDSALVSGTFRISGNRVGTAYLFADTNIIKTLSNSATPSVSGEHVFLTGGTITITNFTEGLVGQIITILSEHAITITDGTNIFLQGSVDFVMASSGSLTLIKKANGFWYEISRSVN